MAAEKIVLIVDDEAMIRESIAAYMAKQGYRVLAAEDGGEALDLFRKHPVSFVILDLMLPGMPGEEVCRRIRKESGVPILMLTARVQEEDILNGLALGADDYVTKPFSVKELHARMEAILRRSADDLKPLAQKFSWNGGELQVDVARGEVRRLGDPVSLTLSEWKILTALLRRPGKVFTREELISLVFGPDFDGTDRVVDTHVKNLRRKLEADPKHPVYILTAHGAGYRFGGDRE